MYRRQETHYTHAWMLGRLCGDFIGLQEYVVTACFEKMIARMQNKLLSLPYFAAITKLPDFQYKETYLEPEKKEIQMEQTFGKALLSLSKLPTTPVTNLQAVISESFDELYTKDTCQEFHQILCELLNSFLLSLKALKALQKPKRFTFDQTVRQVVIYGEALQMMAGGVAIQRHFQVVEEELILSHHQRARDIANQAATLPEEEEETKCEHDDVELQSVQPFAIRDGNALTMSKAAKHWLKLMVVQFDAIKIVDAYYEAAAMTKVTIKIIQPPPLDDKMLTWKDLLQDAKYIKPKNKLSPTSESIVKFLEQQLDMLGVKRGENSILDMQHSVNTLVQSSSSEAVSSDDLQTLEVQLLGFRKGMSPDQDELTCRISMKINQLKKNVDDKSSNSESSESNRELLYSIAELLESLSVSSLFFKKLRGGSALSTGQNFSGVPHCEILLAALIVMAKTSPPLTLPENVRKELSVSHHFRILVIPF